MGTTLTRFSEEQHLSLGNSGINCSQRDDRIKKRERFMDKRNCGLESVVNYNIWQACEKMALNQRLQISRT